MNKKDVQTGGDSSRFDRYKEKNLLLNKINLRLHFQVHEIYVYGPFVLHHLDPIDLIPAGTM